MEKLEKLSLKDFKGFDLKTTHLKTVVGGSRVTYPGKQGPDFVNSTTQETFYKDGSVGDDSL